MKRVSQISMQKIMNIENVRTNLVLSSLYLSSFEILVLATRDSVKDFYKVPKGREMILDERYHEEVKKLDKHILTASCLWLEDMKVISEDEVDEISKIRIHRNEIAHELPRLLIDSDLKVNIDYLIRIKELVEKIDAFWEKTELSIVGIDDFEEAKSGRMLILDHIFSAVLSYLENDTCQK